VKITVSSCAYPHTTDIDITKTADPRELTRLAIRCVMRSKTALEQSLTDYSIRCTCMRLGPLCNVAPAHGAVRFRDQRRPRPAIRARVGLSARANRTDFGHPDAVCQFLR
jgi:hypothetical protein